MLGIKNSSCIFFYQREDIAKMQKEYSNLNLQYFKSKNLNKQVNSIDKKPTTTRNLSNR